jgi:protocatechuate 3,4-dioxygenase beta subunit
MRSHDSGESSEHRSKLSRRDMLGFAATGAAAVVVSQSLLSCTEGNAASTEPAETAPESASTSCVLTAALTEGPYFVDQQQERSDIRVDPVTGAASDGALLKLTFNVLRVASDACTPLTGAFLDVWHCDGAGVYSDVTGAAGRKFLRGYQITDADGVAEFTTIYPGWYTGRAVHVHFKLRLFAGSTRTYEFTSQFFFDEAQTDLVHSGAPYSARGRRNTVNTSDSIFRRLSAAERSALTLQTTRDGDTYVGVINLGVRVG